MAIDAKITIRPEVQSDFGAVAFLHTQAFDGDKVICDLVSELRGLTARFPTLSMIAEDAEGQVVGHVMLSHTWLDADAAMVDVFTLSPLGILPAFQGQGIGKALIASGLAAAKQAGAGLVFLEGNPKYYRGSGFVAAGELGFRRPSLRIPEKAFQVYLIDDTIKDRGTLVMRDAFWQLDCVGLRK
jgi:putative acetyltransferase